MAKFLLPTILTIICQALLSTAQPRYEQQSYGSAGVPYSMAGEFTPYVRQTALSGEGSTFFNPDPESDMYTDHGVPYPGRISRQPRPLSRGIGSYRIGSGRRTMPTQRLSFVRPRQYTRRSGLEARTRGQQSGIYQQAQQQSLSPRFRDLGIQVAPRATRSQYQYANTNTVRLPSRPTRTGAPRSSRQQRFRTRSPSDSYRYVTTRPGEYSRLSLPTGAWQTARRPQGQSTPRRSFIPVRTVPSSRAVVPSLPRASEFVASSGVKRTRVPGSSSTSRESSASRKSSAAKVEIQTKKRAPDSVAKSGGKDSLGFPKLTIQTILRDYNLTATGSYFLTPETRRRNALALQNVVRRTRTQRRRSRRTRRT